MYDAVMTCDDVMMPGDEEMDQLRRRLAETERAMERIVLQLHRPQAGQVSQPSSNQHGHRGYSVTRPSM